MWGLFCNDFAPNSENQFKSKTITETKVIEKYIPSDKIKQLKSTLLDNYQSSDTNIDWMDCVALRQDLDRLIDSLITDVEKWYDIEVNKESEDK